MTAPVTSGAADALPDLSGRLCDWGEIGSAPALLGQWGSVFWATQSADGRVHVAVSSPRRVLLDAHTALLGLRPAQLAEEMGPVAEWLDAQSTWPRVAWSVSLFSAVASRVRASGQSVTMPAAPSVGPIVSEWLMALVWATYYPDTTPLRSLYHARTSTLPTIGQEWTVSPARRETTIFTVEALDPRIRAVLSGTWEGGASTPEGGVTVDGSTSTPRGDVGAASTDGMDTSTVALLLLGGLLLLGDDR